MGIMDRLFCKKKICCIVLITILISCCMFNSFVYAEDPMQVNLAVLRGEKGSSVTIPLTVRNVPESGIYTCSFWVNYDNEIFDSVSITPGELITNSNDFNSNVNSSRGFVAMTFESPADESRVIKSDGNIAYIKLTIMDNVRDGISILSHNLSRASVYATGTDEITGVVYSGGAIAVGNASVPSTVPTQTVTPTATPTATPTPTATHTATATPTATATTRVTATPRPTTTTITGMPTMPGGQVTPTVSPTGGIRIPKDITSHWAKLYVLRLVNRGVIQGYPDGTIKPDNNITRSEAVTALMKSIGYGPAQNAEFDFGDKKDIPNWVKGFLKTALDLKVVGGYEDNTFRASRNVTRQEVVIMLMKTYNFEPSQTSKIILADEETIAPWSKKFVNTACNLEIVKGYSDNTFKPNKNVTRAELFTMIAKCLEYLERQ